MPDKRLHRGPHPEDVKLFAPEKIPDLRSATADFSLLLTKGYAEKSALQLVGDRFSLTKRQRLAVMRSACSDRQLELRRKNRVEIDHIKGRSPAIDGYNLLITIEAAMSGAVILKGRDGSFRDLASIHGTYRKVTETIPAVELLGDFLEEVGVEKALWLLDSPVSNSGRLKKLIGELAEQKNWNWDIQLVLSPDTELIKTDSIVATSDSVILDNCKKWINLTGDIIENQIIKPWIIDLSEV
ncbi:MAG: DUF434 domain-containing protein [Sedimentisphaerales bacterium]|nr:DUF434 domain-containing protein [Sedimentisphaerales bacterium]